LHRSLTGGNSGMRVSVRWCVCGTQLDS